MTSGKFYIDSEYYYTIRKIKNRIIHIPCDKLKAAQRYFLNIVKKEFPYKTNTLTAAGIHSGKKWVLKMDIKDFYNSVPSYEVQKAVAKVCKRLGYRNTFRYLYLVTLNGKLPTGAPTSPHLANACFKRIDKEIMSICSLLGVDYTRYVDDLTFSSYSKETLKIIENKVTALLKFNDYSINEKKTKYLSDNKQQNILGLVVNGYRVRLPKSFKREIRAMLHNYAVNKCNSVQKDEKYLTWNGKKDQQLAGYLAYIENVDRSFYEKLKTYAQKLEHKYYVAIPFFKK